MNEKKFQLERVHGAAVSNDEILSDIQNAAKLAGTNIISQRLYSQFGKYDPTTASRRFGTWNKAVLAAGLKIANEINISDKRLFENLMRLWEHYGRQPALQNLLDLPRLFPEALIGGDSILGWTRSHNLSNMQTPKTCDLPNRSKLPVTTKQYAIPRSGCGFE